MTYWNVVWVDNTTQEERITLARRSREEALSYVESYFPAFDQKALHQWQFKDDICDFSVKLEKV